MWIRLKSVHRFNNLRLKPKKLCLSCLVKHGLEPIKKSEMRYSGPWNEPSPWIFPRLARVRREARVRRKMKTTWMGSYGVAVLVGLLGALSIGTSTEQLSTRECENLGFSGLALCSDCNTFSEYVKDKGQINLWSLSKVSFKSFFFFFFFKLLL